MFLIEQSWFFKDTFLFASTFLDPRVQKFKKFEEKEATNAIKNAKKYIKKLINDHEIDSVAASTPTAGEKNWSFLFLMKWILMINHKLL